MKLDDHRWRKPRSIDDYITAIINNLYSKIYGLYNNNNGNDNNDNDDNNNN